VHAWADEAGVWLKLGWAVEMLPDDCGWVSKQRCGRLIGLSTYPITALPRLAGFEPRTSSL